MSELALRETLARLLERYTQLVNCGDCGNWNPEKEDEVIAARAALATPTEWQDIESAPKVKPLEWHDFERGGGSQYANSLLGRIDAWEDGVGHYRIGDRLPVRGGPDTESAKAAAPADYESRILSALVAPPASRNGEGRT